MKAATGPTEPGAPEGQGDTVPQPAGPASTVELHKRDAIGRFKEINNSPTY